ncbi:MAG TPA: CBS domain-containing protein [Thermodesulfobacteriota bacterium]|nr:CBS domain-containing protein [Thermodesulfobacteriota bacterium]
MERLKKAGELMIPLDKYPHVPHWFTLRQAMAVLEKTKLHPDLPGGPSLARFVLVFDETYKLLGITRRRDILRGLKPQFLAGLPTQAPKTGPEGKPDPVLPEVSYDKMLQGLREQAERPVSEIMLPIQGTIDYEEDIFQVIYKMVEINVSMLPVLRENMVAGVVRSVEIFHEIAELIL